MSLMKRSIINPSMTVTGGVVAISGVFLLFHYESHLIKAMHEICAFTLLAFAIMHIILNWKALINTLKGRLSVRFVLVVFAICTALMVVTGEFIIS